MSDVRPRNNNWRPFSETLHFTSAISGKELGPRIAHASVGVASDDVIDGEADKAASFLEAGYRLSLDTSNTLPTGGAIPGLHADEVVSSRQALARLDMALRLLGHQDWTTKLINQDQRDAVEGALSLRDNDMRTSGGRAGDPIISAALQFSDQIDRLVDQYASFGRALEEYKADKAHPNYAWLQQQHAATLEALVVLATAGASPADIVKLLQRLACRLDRDEAVKHALVAAAAARKLKEAADREHGRAHDALQKLSAPE